MGDDRRLSQVLLNLLGNAVKFARGGVVRLRVAPVGGSGVRFEVIDNGAGISPEQLPLIFDPYVQGGGATARRHGGTGLGLAIARGLVGAMGGELGAQSRLGEGSTFSFEVVLPAVSLGGRPQGALAARLDGVRVLVAEDNVVNLGVLHLLLESLGAQVLEAHDGGEALRETLVHRPDVLILDLHMPVLDGPAVSQRLRETGYSGAILALTASVLSEDRIMCLEAGMNAVATKPITRERLATALQALLRGRASA
jgi:CheY-like chemotaxis protein